MNLEQGTQKLEEKKNFEGWFEEIYEINFERLYRYAFSITKDKQLSEDAVSEVFANLWRDKRDNYHDIIEPQAYLYTSVRNSALRQAAKMTDRFSYSDDEKALQVSEVVNPENLLIGKELDQLIQSITDGLSPHAQHIYHLAKVEGYSHKKISDKLGITVRTVENTLYKIMKVLKKGLASYLKNPKRKSQLMDKLLSFLF